MKQFKKRTSIEVRGYFQQFKYLIPHIAGKSFKFPSIVTQATSGQEGHCLGVAGVHDACSYRGDAVRGGGV